MPTKTTARPITKVDLKKKFSKPIYRIRSAKINIASIQAKTEYDGLELGRSKAELNSAYLALGMLFYAYLHGLKVE